MFILAIDTSSRSGSIALLRDNEVVDQIAGHEETLYSTRLFRDLEILQSRARFRMDHVDVFAVAAGPGSFTGLRVGLTAVKAWAEVHGKPIAPVSGLESVAAQSEALKYGPTGQYGVIAPFLDARRGQLFGSIYRQQPGTTQNPVRPALQLIGEESVFSAAEFVALVKGTSHFGPPVFVSPTPNTLSISFLTEIFPGACVETVSPVLAPVIAQLAYQQAKRGELVDALHLDANYVRRSDAESAWKDTRSGYAIMLRNDAMR